MHLFCVSNPLVSRLKRSSLSLVCTVSTHFDGNYGVLSKNVATWIGDLMIDPTPPSPKKEKREAAEITRLWLTESYLRPSVCPFFLDDGPVVLARTP